MTIVRDAFIARLHTLGLSCAIAPPTLVVEDVPSFGQYRPSSNTLRTSDWHLLNPQEHAFLAKLAGPGADEAHTRELYEVAAHQWIFIHELGHWWQACRGGNEGRSHYQVEYEANRVSLAYWRSVDPTVVDTMMPVFQNVVDHMPSPLPAGQAMQPYFDANYETLGPSPAYPWFMSRMNLAAYQETPAPSLESVLSAIGKSSN